jgi:hypothetical protein
MNNHKWQVFLIGLSISITIISSFILAKVSNQKHLFPVFVQISLWCIASLAMILTFVNCCLLYSKLKQSHHHINQKKKAIKDYHCYHQLLNPPELNT